MTPDVRPIIPHQTAPCGWSSLQFYAYIVRNIGVPASFNLVGTEWVAEGPFTNPVPESVLSELEKHGV